MNVDLKLSRKNLTLNMKSLILKYFRCRYLMILLLPAVIWYAVFCYIPMYGATIAFKDYRVMEGILGSEWVGLKHFYRLFTGTSNFLRVFRNTLLISIYRIIFEFPIPVVLALLLNELRNIRFKKVVQTVSYLPHFLSWVILSGIIMQILSLSAFHRKAHRASPGSRMQSCRKVNIHNPEAHGVRLLYHIG